MQTHNTASSPQAYTHRHPLWQQRTTTLIQKSKEFSAITSNLSLVQVEHPSLYLSETISSIGKQQYFITPQLLVGTTVSEFKRAVLRSWIYEQGTKLDLDRSTIATANYLIDLFLEKGGEVVIEDFQILAISALILVNKSSSQQNKVSVNERLFPRKLLNEFQLKICKRLNFRINPVTYVQVLDQLVCTWNIFAERHSDLWSYQNGGKQTQTKDMRSFSCHSIYQLLDTIFLVVKSFAFNLFELVLQVFRVFLLKDYQTISSLPKSIEDEVIISFWHNPQDQPLMGSSFDSIFRHFLNFIESSSSSSKEMSIELSQNRQIEAFVLSFLRGGFESTIQRQILPSKSPHVQTYNPVCLQVARKFIHIKKNHRKSSGETLAI